MLYKNKTEGCPGPRGGALGLGEGSEVQDRLGFPGAQVAAFLQSPRVPASVRRQRQKGGDFEREEGR